MQTMKAMKAMQAKQAKQEKQEKQEKQAAQAKQEDIERLQQDCKSQEAVAEKRAQECKAGRQRGEAVLSAARQNLEDVVSQSEEAGRASAERLVEAIRHIEEATKKREEAAVQMEVAAKTRELGALQMAKAAADMLQQALLLETEKAKDAFGPGVRPVMPTLEQISAAHKRAQYDPEKLHFAVCGTSGSGKSTFINAVRGLANHDHGAARVGGVTKCKSAVTRYPDLRKQLPYSQFVWYDIPGAGTKGVPDWQYFTDQGLFVFDFIILVYDDCFTKMDVGIVDSCLRFFNIPLFIARSKADQHIANTLQQARDCESRGDKDHDIKVYREMARRYVGATRLIFDKRMQTMAEAGLEYDLRDRQMLLGHRVYIVAAATLRNLMQTASVWRGQEVDVRKIIDETLLIDDILRAVAGRTRPTKPAEDVE